MIFILSQVKPLAATWLIQLMDYLKNEDAFRFRDSGQWISLTWTIKTHGSVSCGPKSQHATPLSILTKRTVTQFSHICNFVLLVQNWAIFAVEMPYTVSSPYSKIQVSRARSVFLRYEFSKISIVSIPKVPAPLPPPPTLDGKLTLRDC